MAVAVLLYLWYLRNIEIDEHLELELSASYRLPSIPVYLADIDEPLPEIESYDIGNSLDLNVLVEKGEVPELDNRNLPISWSLEVGVFAEIIRAKFLRDALRGSGFKSYIRKVSVESGASEEHVYIGPEFTLSKIKAIDADFFKIYSRNGRVVRFTF